MIVCFRTRPARWRQAQHGRQIIHTGQRVYQIMGNYSSRWCAPRRWHLVNLLTTGGGAADNIKGRGDADNTKGRGDADNTLGEVRLWARLLKDREEAGDKDKYFGEGKFLSRIFWRRAKESSRKGQSKYGRRSGERERQTTTKRKCFRTLTKAPLARKKHDLQRTNTESIHNRPNQDDISRMTLQHN